MLTVNNPLRHLAASPARKTALAGILFATLTAFTACGSDVIDSAANKKKGSPTNTEQGSDGQTNPDSSILGDVVEYPNLSRNHVQGAVSYPQNPPVGGDHAPVWMNCGTYNAPVEPGTAVHSMEHGAVWITYDPSLASADVDVLEALADRNGFVLVSPVEGMDEPVVATAWGRQLPLGSVDQATLTAFVDTFAQGPQTPELGAPCTGGLG
ncbi:DUF3105 domain-containing protein [Pimelobacter simplex]|uniref:DUF3105 domain-containing protein n=1 Tax=Nocardioides simplex TaxID=2045 RepID=UPI00214F7834|nr:DUF3105 domain-containing protein [Pimelobacter simplex]UUW88763.1 DUF3105 domain-containing protein [Pimelobacter simplex]UUW98268.1 DUF3105 domain-containing protein [Pimelobacter simplex]